MRKLLISVLLVSVLALVGGTLARARQNPVEDSAGIAVRIPSQSGIT